MTDVIAAAVSSKIKVGDLVMVAFPVSEQTNNPARKLDGRKFTVKSVHKVNWHKSQRIVKQYYELYKAKSDKGVYYGFLEDELIKL